MAKIVLHQWVMSPFCNKVRRALRHKGLAFEVKDYNGLSARNAAKLSTVGTLPVIDHDGERVADSSAIAAFLDVHYPQAPLYPTDPEARARVRFWEDWAAQSLYFLEIYFRMLDPVALEKALDLVNEGRPGYERAILKVIMKRRYPKKLKAQGLGKLPPQDVEAKLVEHLDGLEVLLGKNPWLVGDAPSIADLSVAAQIDEIVRTSRMADKIRSYRKLGDWLGRLPAA